MQYDQNRGKIRTNIVDVLKGSEIQYIQNDVINGSEIWYIQNQFIKLVTGKNVLKGRENGKVNGERGRCEASTFFMG